MADPVSTFLNSMNTTASIMKGMRQDERQDQLFGMQMAAYQRAERKEREAEDVSKAKRETAATLSRLESGVPTGEDIARVDSAAGVELGELAGLYDEEAQKKAVGYVWPIFDKVAKGGALEEQEREPIWAAGAALRKAGILAPTLPEIREQAAAAGSLKNSIVMLGDQFGPQLLGKKTAIDEASDPELFRNFSMAFPAITGGSQAFKDGRGRVVQFYVDGTGVTDPRELRIIPVLEGVNPQTGETYRAPMSLRRSSDPDDPVSTTPLGRIYADATFAENAANTLLASIAGIDDEAAQKTIDKYSALADKAAEVKREFDRAKSFAADPEVAKLVEGNPALQAALKGVKLGTYDSKSFVAAVTAQAAENYKKTKDEESARVTLLATVDIARTMGGKTAKMAEQVIARLNAGGYPSYSAALEANKELLKLAGDLDKETLQGEYGLKKEKLKGEFELKKEREQTARALKLEKLKGSSEGKGKTDLITLKTGRKITLDDARQAYLATYGKPDGAGGFTVESSAPSFSSWINGQAVEPVFEGGAQDDPALLAKAEEMADKWVKGQAGFLSSDSSDFAKYGGNREQARAAKVKEFYAMLSGDEAGTGASPSGVATQAGNYTKDEAVAAARRAIASGKDRESIIARLEEMHPGAGKLVGEVGPSAAVPAKAATQGGGMAPPKRQQPTQREVREQIQTNIPRDNPITKANEYPVELVQRGLNQLANYFVVNPAKAAASDIARPFKAFQQWAKTRYSKPGAEALAEYAKVDPQGAKIITARAAQLAR